MYYLESASGEDGGISLKVQLKENTDNWFKFYPMNEGVSFGKVFLNGTETILSKCPCGMYTASLKIPGFTDRPAVNWTSGWKYHADSAEVRDTFDDSAWKYLEKPMSLEEADMFKHGYYWYRAQFEVNDEKKANK